MRRINYNRLFLATVFILSLLLPAGCSAKNNVYETEIFAMDTVMDLKAWGKNAEPAVEAAAAEISRLEQLFSVTIETSEIYKLNTTGTAQVSDDTLTIIKKAEELCTRTNGALDITIYPIMRLWGFTTSSYRVPSDAEIKSTLQYVGAGHVKISGNTVTLDKGTELDLGAIAKGYASDKLMEIFKKYDVDSALISLGGNVVTLGRKDGKDNWRVGIENPQNTDDVVGILSVSDKAVITSGGYQRYFDQDGKRYIHIFDPSTGYPAESGLSSVTIVSSSGTLGDGLSTPLYVMGLQKAVDFWRVSDDFEAVFIDNGGKIYVTEGLKDAFSDCPAGFTVISRS